MFKKLFCLIAILVTLPVMAQKLDMNIVSVVHDQFSTTAQKDSRYAELDKGGDLYAIVKVKTADGQSVPEGLSFDFGGPNVLKKEMHDDELWLWVQRNAKTVTVKHADYKTISKYNLGLTLQPGQTYVMTMHLDLVVIIEKHTIRKQVLQFEVTPTDEHAIVKIKAQGASDYELWGEVDANGTIDKQLDFGTYEYMVTAENYETSYGRVTLSDNKNTWKESVTLTPNFGFLEVTGDYGCNGAEVYINDRKVGTIPYTSGRLECRDDYRIAVTQGDLYKPYSSIFSIRQGETTRLAPQLQSDFASTTLRVDNDAEIYIDGVFMGKGTWSGPRKGGQYTITCKKDKHRESSKVITVRPDVDETFDLPAPTPITGGLYVRTTPSGATISIDGEDYGTTPRSLSDLIIGEHQVTLTLKNYKSETRTVTVEEGKQAELDVTLSDFAQMKIGSHPSGANLYIDGKLTGVTPYTQEMPSGDYKVRLTKRGYHDYEKTIHLDSSQPSATLSMQRQYIQPMSAYVQPTFLAGSTMAVGAVVGGYIYNFNIEAGYMMGLSKADVYWNNASGETPRQETLKPSIISARLGYGFTIGTRLRITPQVGANIVSVTGDISKSNATAATIGCRAEYALANYIGVTLTPEYGIAVKKSDTYKRLMDAGVKDFAGGIGVKVGINIFF